MLNLRKKLISTLNLCESELCIDDTNKLRHEQVDTLLLILFIYEEYGQRNFIAHMAHAVTTSIKLLTFWDICVCHVLFANGRHRLYKKYIELETLLRFLRRDVAVPLLQRIWITTRNFNFKSLL